MAVLVNGPVLRWWADQQLFRSYRIPSGAMMNTLLIGDHIIGDMRTSRLFSLERGEIVIFQYPPEPEVLYIKRVVGMPGERIEMIDGYLYANGEFVEESYVEDEYRLNDHRFRNFGPVTIDEGYYFVLGDHRNESSDQSGLGPGPALADEGARPRDLVVPCEADPSPRFRRCGALVPRPRDGGHAHPLAPHRRAALTLRGLWIRPEENSNAEEIAG